MAAESEQSYIILVLASLVVIFLFFWSTPMFWHDFSLEVTKNKLILMSIILSCFTFLNAWSMYIHPEYWTFPDSMDKHPTFRDCFHRAIYYTVVCHSSIGFGDISPNHPLTRTITFMHAIIIIVFSFAR